MVIVNTGLVLSQSLVFLTERTDSFTPLLTITETLATS
jgi:hypothetical protein